MKRCGNGAVLLVLLSVSVALAQPGPGGPPPGPGGPPPGHRGPMDHGLRGGPPGKWWDNPETVQRLGITADQQKKMDDVFQQHRLRLIDLNAALQKEEAVLEPLIQAETPDDSKVLAQIDRVAQARADLEKASARLLLGLRHVLTPDQWKKLQNDDQGPPQRRGPDGGGPPPRRR